MSEESPVSGLRRLLTVVGVVAFVPAGAVAVLGIARGDLMSAFLGLILIVTGVEAWEGIKSMDWLGRAPVTGGEALIGRSAEVVQDCSPQGTVKIDGELWRAVSKTGDPVAAGRRVAVVDVRGLTLTVEAHGPSGIT